MLDKNICCCIVVELKRDGRKKITLKLRKYARERL